MLAEARSAVGRAYVGYKGGTFMMSLKTPVHRVSYSDYYGDEDALTDEALEEMLGTPANSDAQLVSQAPRDKYDDVLHRLRRYIESATPAVSVAIDKLDYPDDLLALKANLESCLDNLNDFLGDGK